MNTQFLPDSSEHPTLLRIEGMSCAGCVRSVENALAGVPGVDAASVNFASETAAVTGAFDAALLLQAVKNAGYDARPYEQQSIAAQEEDISQAFRWSFARSAVALAGGAMLMADMYFGWLPPLTAPLPWLIIGLLTLGVMVLAGGHFYRGAVAATLNRTATMDTLIALGTGTAWIYSMGILLVPEFFPEASRHQFFEAALFIIGFVNLGKALENNARSRSSLAIQRLFDRTPEMVRKLTDDREEFVPLVTIVAGDHIRIVPGDYVPVDGEVLEGTGSVDESMLTGESAPVEVQAGDRVKAGTVNVDGALVIKAISVGSATTLASMMRLVAEAQNSKPAVARLVDQISAVFVPVVVLIALMAMSVWYLAGPEPALSHAVVVAMSVLIIACPCALGLAVPMSIIIGIGRAAARGMLVRNSEVLQSAAGLDVIVFDKTGTLTRGQPMVTEVRGLNAEQQAVAAGLAALSNHPLSSAIVRYCESQGVPARNLTDFSSQAGGGISGKVGAEVVQMGSRAYLEAARVAGLTEVEVPGSVVYLAIAGEVKGCFLLRDEIRAEAAGVLSQLSALGVESVMLTGDRQEVAAEIAAKLGLSAFHAGLSPEQKLEWIKCRQAEGQSVGMVGDGTNDAAALAAADVGFAMGEGTDVAIESADVTLISESLASLESTITLSRKILGNIRQNLFAAFAYNVLLIPVAAGLLYPLTGWLMDPALAGLAMALSSVSVVANASRLARA